MKLNEISDENVLRDGEFEALGIVDSNVSKGILTFIDHEKYMEKLLVNKNITCIITTFHIGNKLMKETQLGIYTTLNPRVVFFRLHNELAHHDCYKRKSYESIIGHHCDISPLSCISKKNVTIGDNVQIEEFVSIKENVVIGNNCIIRAGSVIGGVGFEYKRENDETFAVEHCGGVILKDNVEVQYNCTIDRAIFPWDNTLIGDYVKLDNLVHIGHAVIIRNNVLFPAGTTVSGRVKIDDNVWIGVGSVILNGVHFGENSRCNIGSVVTKDVAVGASVTGNFAIEHSRFIENLKKSR